MDINELVATLTNNGALVVVLAYFIFRDYKYIDALLKVLQKILDTMTSIERGLDNAKNKKDSDGDDGK